MSQHLSRLAFLKKLLTGVSALILASHERTIAPSPIDSQFSTKDSTTTKQIKPTSTNSPTSNPDETPTPSYLKLIIPKNGERLPEAGKIRFLWKDHPSAEKYLFLLVLPNKTIIPLGTTSNTYRDQYLDPLGGGDYEWFITAFDKDDNRICSSRKYTFSKSSILSPSANIEKTDPKSSYQEPPTTVKPPTTTNH